MIFTLPEIVITLGISYETLLCFYLSKAVMDLAGGAGTGNSMIDDDLVNDAVNGGLFYWNIGERSNFDQPSSTSSKSAQATITSKATVLNSLIENMPFTGDEDVDLDGGDGNNFYEMLPYVEKMDNGAYIVAFHMKYGTIESQDIDGDGIAEALYVKVRIYIYNPLTMEMTNVITGGGYTIDTIYAGIAETANRHWYVQTAIWRDRRDNSLYLLGTHNNNANSYPNTEPRETFMVKIGTLDVTGGTDVPPPYIIKQILTNDWFGLNIPDSMIDDTSYGEAYNYCVTQGFLVSTQYRRDENVLSIIEDLLSLYGGFLVVVDGKIYFKVLEFETAPVRTIDNDHLLQDQPGTPPVKITKGAKQDTFNSVKVNFIDRKLDYEQNQVTEADEVDQDLDRIRAREFPPRYVMKEKMARTMASRTLWSNLYARDTYEFKLGWKDADLVPGDVITLVDSFHTNLSGGVTARIVTWKESKRGQFDITAKQEFAYIAATSAEALDITSASNVQIIQRAPEPRDFRMYELPAEFATESRLYVGWQPWGFAAGAVLHVSVDGVSYAEAQRASPYPLAGTILTGMGAVGGSQENVDVLLFPNSDWPTTTSYNILETLNEVSPAARAIGAGLIWIGSEMIAYQGVNLLAQNHYRFDTIFRGWGGTHIHAHNSGDLWHKHGGGVFTQEFNEDKIGTIIYYKVQPYNLAGAAYDISSIDAKTYQVLGSYWRPQVAPTPRYIQNSTDWRGLTKIWVTSEGDIPIDWRDSARMAGYGVGGFGTGEYGRFTVDAISHAWRVEVVGSGDTVVRSVSVTTAHYNYTNSLNFSDNGAWRGNIAFKVTPYNAYGDAPRTEVVSLELFT